MFLGYRLGTRFELLVPRHIFQLSMSPMVQAEEGQVRASTAALTAFENLCNYLLSFTVFFSFLYFHLFRRSFNFTFTNFVKLIRQFWTIDDSIQQLFSLCWFEDYNLHDFCAKDVHSFIIDERRGKKIACGQFWTIDRRIKWSDNN